MEGLNKKEKRHMNIDNNTVTAEWRMVEVDEGIRGISGNKKYNNIKKHIHTHTKKNIERLENYFSPNQYITFIASLKLLK